MFNKLSSSRVPRQGKDGNRALSSWKKVARTRSPERAKHRSTSKVALMYNAINGIEARMEEDEGDPSVRYALRTVIHHS